MENFDDQKISTVNREQYAYRQEHQKQEEEELRKAVIKKQTGLLIPLIFVSYVYFFSGWQVGEILEKIRVHAEIQKVALTLYLGESNLVRIFWFYPVCFYSVESRSNDVFNVPRIPNWQTSPLND